MLLKIDLKKSPEEDIALIHRYFFETKTDHFKKRILRFYKTLEDKLSTETEENHAQVIDSFFKDIYRNKAEEIETIVDQSEKIIDEESTQCLGELAKLMDYDTEKEEIFIAIPTLLPFSPFNRPIFYFSIVSSLFKDGKNSILDTAIHEISHFLLFDILDELEINLNDTQENKDFLHLFKEALTGMLLSEKEMSECLGMKEYFGNPEVHNLNIKLEDGKQLVFREYLRSILHQYRQQDLSFQQFIADTIEILRPKAEEFSKKKIFWNKNEQKILNRDEELSKEYGQPILIQ